MPMRSMFSTMSEWTLSTSSWGVTPASSAAMVMGVPCSSEPDTRMARSPLMRRKRV